MQLVVGDSRALCLHRPAPQHVCRPRTVSRARHTCRAVADDTSLADQAAAPSRRQLLAASLAAAAASCIHQLPQAVAAEAPSAQQFARLQYGTLAFEFQYPLQTASGKPLNVIFSRKPERYSSAAPLTSDARQRIVAELVNLPENVTMSVSVGPPSGVLASKPPQEWSPKEVANTILTDRSTARVSTGQRVSLNQVENAAKEERDGGTYWVYEHLSQGSPTLLNKDKESYRHAVAVTSWRNGKNGEPFLYTLNLACPEERWPDLEPMFQKSIASFRLTSPTKEYVAPDEQPWRFF